jgi:uncharacterized protein YlxW (UPF0749 family)
MSMDVQHQDGLVPDSRPDKKQGIMQRSKDMLDTAVSGLKGRDMFALVDSFTSEMTLVAEGLSEDLQHTQQQVAQLGADQTIFSEDGLRVQEQIKQLQKRVETLENRHDKQTAKRGTLTGVLRQLTVIAAMIAAAWVITALLGTFGGK